MSPKYQQRKTINQKNKTATSLSLGQFVKQYEVKKESKAKQLYDIQFLKKIRQFRANNKSIQIVNKMKLQEPDCVSYGSDEIIDMVNFDVPNFSR